MLKKYLGNIGKFEKNSRNTGIRGKNIAISREFLGRKIYAANPSKILVSYRDAMVQVTFESFSQNKRKFCNHRCTFLKTLKRDK